jgi:uroporphyrinogen decarboxylase
MTSRENYLRAVQFQHPEWIPCGVGFAPAVWQRYREDLERIMLDHPRLFPDYQAGSACFYDEMPVVYRQGEYYRDNWGCLWYNAHAGLEGQVVESPLADWSRFADYQPPDPLVDNERGEEKKDWDQIRADCEKARAEGRLVGGNGERLFDRLYFLRGFENLMVDIATDDPHLPALIEMLTDYELKLVRQWLEIGVDLIGFHTDIGTQRALMISPAKFRKYIKPMFMEIFQTCRQGGALVGLSSDGHLLEIVDDLIECGVSMHDPQLRANTLEGIAAAYKGKLCANVDLDRQSFAFLTPTEIREQVAQVVEVMNAPEGGLMVSGSIWDEHTPLRNTAALCEAVEEFCFP